MILNKTTRTATSFDSFSCDESLFPELPCSMSKTLCDWSKKDIERHAAELLTIVTPQNFICFKCARTACDKHYLCRPESIEKIQRRAARDDKSVRQRVVRTKIQNLAEDFSSAIP